MEFKTSYGQIFLADAEDAFLITPFKWQIRMTANKDKYVGRSFGSECILLHRAVMYVTDKRYVIHLDKNGLNNQKANLEIVSRSNIAKDRRVHGTSKYRGVSWNKLLHKWTATINIDGKQEYLGVYKDEKDAAKVYNAAAIATGNPYYVINDVD